MEIKRYVVMPIEHQSWGGGTFFTVEGFELDDGSWCRWEDVEQEVEKIKIQSAGAVLTAECTVANLTPRD